MSGTTQSAPAGESSANSADSSDSTDRPLRILVNGSSARVGGGLSVLTHQLRAFQSYGPANQLTVLAAPWNVDRLRSEVAGSSGGVGGARSSVTIEPIEVESTQDRIRFEQAELPGRANGFDLLFNPANLAPLRGVTVPSVLMLQNVAYFGDGPSFASHQSPVERLKRRMVRASVGRCDAVVVPTQSLAEAVVGDLPRAAAKLHLIRPGPFSSASANSEETGGNGNNAHPSELHGCSDVLDLTGASTSVGSSGASPARLGAATAAAAQVLQTHVVGDGYLLSVANYYDYKRLEDVVAAWARADADGLNLDLLMVGSVPTDVLGSLRDLVPTDRRDRLHFHGPVANPDHLRQAYLGATAVVCLSALECLSLVPVEAAALGVPVVMSDIGVHLELAAAEGAGAGLHTVPVDDVGAAAAAITKAVSAPRPAPVNLLSDWASHVAAMQALFIELVDRQRNGGIEPGTSRSGRLWRSASGWVNR